MSDNSVLFSVHLPGIPAFPLEEYPHLSAQMAKNLITRLRTLQAAYNARVLEIAELRMQVASLQVICDGLAEDLEACYACHDQGAWALATEAAEEVRDGNH